MIRQVAAVAALLALAGCTSGDGGPPLPPPSGAPPPPTTAPPTTATTAPPTTATTAVPTTKPAVADVTACFDGQCELEVRRSVQIPLDPALRISDLTVTVSRGGVLASAEGGALQTGGSAGSTLTLNDTLRIEILSARGTTARILLSQPNR